MIRRRDTRSSEINAWPGYVDALSTLLMVVVFVLLVFILAHTFMSTTLTKREDMFNQLQKMTEKLSAQLIHAKEENLKLTTQRDYDNNLYLSEQQRSLQMANQLELLNKKLATIQLSYDTSRQELKIKDTQILQLGRQLDEAMAKKISQLEKYRSEFFGRLQEILKNQPGVQIVGDRFVFQSEVLFPSSSAELSPDGREQLIQMAQTLKEIAKKIPSDIPWILRIDGHADRQPIHSTFPSNWELSSARAITVVRLLISQGINPSHLAATGFAEYQPLMKGNTPEDYARNRRIELRLTDR